MSQNELPQKYRQVFSKLKSQLDQVPSGKLHQQSPEFIEQFAFNYLQAIALFTWVKNQKQWNTYVPLIRKLLVQANITLYPESQTSVKKLFISIFAVLPAQLWNDRYYHLFATGLSLLMAVVAFFLVCDNFELASVFMPSDLRSLAELDAYIFSPEARHEMLSYGRDETLATKAFFAVWLMKHNITVAVICFLSGFLFGLPTFYMTIQNGLMLGTLPALFYPDDIVELGAWLLPHGVPELSAIFIAGGAGFKIGLTLLHPQGKTMARALRDVLKQLTGTVFVLVFLLIWAGLVESFVRQSHLSTIDRYGIVGLSILVMMFIYYWGWRANDYLSKKSP